MNMRMLSLSSLLLAVGFMSGNQQAWFNAKHEKASIKLEQARKAQNEALNKLYQTEEKEGASYKKSRDEYNKCTSESECLYARKAVKEALKNLKETPGYNEFYPFTKEVAYWENLTNGLNKISYVAGATWIGLREEEEKAKEMTRVIISNKMGGLAKADAINILWAEDVREDEQRAQHKLFSLVRKSKLNRTKEIKANNKLIKKIDAAMPAYQ